MKVIYKFILLLIVIFSIVSCVEEPYTEVTPNFILSFQRDGRTTALAGVPFYVIPTVDAEFITLYDGKQGHVWGEAGAVGTDFNKADSLGIRYDSIGHFTVSLVATSIGKLGEKITRLAKSVDVNVVDERNAITQFTMNDMYGTITDTQILFSFPDVTPDFNFSPFFVIESNSSACSVTVNGVLQESGVTAHTFTPSVPVIYTVKSPAGKEKSYSVIVTTYKSSNEAKLTKFNLASGIGTNGFGEVGIIDHVNKTITLNANYATDLTGVRVKAESSFASALKITTSNGTSTYTSTKFYNLSNSTKAKVTAEDKVTLSTYALNLIIQDPVTDFTFDGFSQAPIRVIDTAAKTISIDVAKGTDITKLKAVWTGTLGTVSLKYGSRDSVQTSGMTVNDFSTPRKYTFYKGNNSATNTSLLKSGDVYTVYVNLK